MIRSASEAGQASDACADMVELADTPDLGSGGRPCRFESCYPHDGVVFWNGKMDGSDGKPHGIRVLGDWEIS